MTNYHNLHRRKSCLNKHNATTWRAKDKMNVSVTQWFPNCEPQLILPRGAANYYNFIFFIISPDRRTSSAIRRVIWIWIWLRWQPIRQKEWEGDFEKWHYYCCSKKYYTDVCLLMFVCLFGIKKEHSSNYEMNEL